MASSSAIRAGRAFVEIFANDDKLQQTLKRSQRRLQLFAASVAHVGRSLIVPSSVIVAPFAALTVGAIQSAGAYEQLEVAFSTMLGSGTKAKKLLDELSQFAIETPFQSDEINTAARSLLAFGVEADQIVPTLRRIGDVASGVGTPLGELAEIYGKAKVQGRLFAEDINQLTGRGIPVIQELAKQFGVTDSEVRDLVESGQIGFPQLEAAFVALTGTGGRFEAMMEKQSGTFLGLFGAIMDGVGKVQKIIGQALMPIVKQITQGVMQLTTSITKWMEENRAAVISAVMGAAAAVAVVGAVLAAGVGLVAIGFALSGIATAIGIVSSLLAMMGTVLAAVPGLFMAILSPIGLVLAAIAGIGVYMLYASGIIGDVIDGGMQLFRDLAGDVGQSWQAIVDLVSAGDLAAAMEIPVLLFRVAWARVSGFVTKIWSDLSQFFTNVWGEATKTLSSLFLNAYYGVSSAFVAVIGTLKAVWQDFLEIFRKGWQTASNWISKGVLTVMAKFDDSIDVDEAMKELEAINQAENDRISSENTAPQMRDERDQQLAKIAADQEASLAELDQMRQQQIDAAERDRNASVSEADAAVAAAQDRLSKAVKMASAKRVIAERAAKQTEKERKPLATQLEGVGQMSKGGFQELKFAQASDVRSSEGMAAILATFSKKDPVADGVNKLVAETQKGNEDLAQIKRNTATGNGTQTIGLDGFAPA